MVPDTFFGDFVRRIFLIGQIFHFPRRKTRANGVGDGRACVTRIRRAGAACKTAAAGASLNRVRSGQLFPFPANRFLTIHAGVDDHGAHPQQRCAARRSRRQMHAIEPVVNRRPRRSNGSGFPAARGRTSSFSSKSPAPLVVAQRQQDAGYEGCHARSQLSSAAPVPPGFRPSNRGGFIAPPRRSWAS